VIRRLLIITAFTGFMIAGLTGFATTKEPPSPHMGNNTYNTFDISIFYKIKTQQAQMGKQSFEVVSSLKPEPKPIIESAPVRTARPIQSGLATPAQVADWAMTAICETGKNWSMQGPIYSGGLGMLNSTWQAYGGTQFAPNAGLATPQEQVTVALRIQPNAPDPGYCTGSW
jgi:hypothetical protein